ncbi:MAG TPA: hypothetical protein VM241_09255 [Candidatus Thermoplasmatota archaeon]|nr:hypothetical protein [Candidatus Thermoplasmatota archaeon]
MSPSTHIGTSSKTTLQAGGANGVEAEVGLSILYDCPDDPTACTRLLGSTLTITGAATLRLGPAADVGATVSVSILLPATAEITVVLTAGSNISPTDTQTKKILVGGTSVSFDVTVVGDIGTRGTVTLTASDTNGSSSQPMTMQVWGVQ